MGKHQQLFNICLSLVGFLGALQIYIMWENINKSQATAEVINSELTQVKVLVAGDYVKKEDLKYYITDLSAKLSRIEEKLDNKEDKK